MSTDNEREGNGLTSARFAQYFEVAMPLEQLVVLQVGISNNQTILTPAAQVRNRVQERKRQLLTYSFARRTTASNSGH